MGQQVIGSSGISRFKPEELFGFSVHGFHDPAFFQVSIGGFGGQFQLAHYKVPPVFFLFLFKRQDLATRKF